MKTVALSDVTESIDYGVTASANLQPVGPKFLRITDIQDGSVDWSSVPFCDAGNRKLATSRLKPGDIVFARTGATTGKSFLIRSCPEGAVFASYLIRVRPNPDVSPPFLAHFFDSPGYWNQISLKAVGAAQPGVNSSRLKELVVPLPTLTEQCLIAAILDQADVLRRKRRHAMEVLEGLARAYFLEMFGDPLANAMEWPVRTLGEIGELERGVSKHRPRNDPTLLNGPYPLIQTGDIANCDGYVRRYDNTYSDAGLRQSRLWPNGTLCITIAANIGKTGILSFDACFPDSVVGFKPGCSIRTEYVQFWMSFIQKILEHDAPQFAQKNINLAILRGLKIPVPPTSMQDMFAQKVRAIDRLKSSYRAHLGKLETLFASLQHRAFSGELTAKDAERELALAG